MADQSSRVGVIAFALFVTLALFGCEGATGEVGPTGKQGEAGAAGVPGVNGADGAKGATGAKGQDGAAGAKGDAGAKGTDGAKGDKGEPGDMSWAKGAIAGLVTAAVDGKPLAGVSVSTAPLGKTAKTGADGKFKLEDLLVGAYSLTFKLEGHADGVLGGVGVAPQTTTDVTLALAVGESTAGEGPVLGLTDNLLAGFGKVVTLKAKVEDADSDLSKITMKWTQLTGAKVTLKGADGDTLSFTTAPLAATVPAAQLRFGVVGINPEAAGNYNFELTATDPEGNIGKATVRVRSAPSAPGLRNTAVGMPVYLAGDNGQKTWKWTLDKAPPGAKAVLVDETTQTPHLIPDIKGEYKLTESVSGKTLELSVGTWDGAIGSSTCDFCHDDDIAPDMFKPWMGTKHYKSAEKLLDTGAAGLGKPDIKLTEACFECHSVGYSYLAKNGGFDEVVSDTNWQVPEAKVGNWDELVKSNKPVAKLITIQCENCHGPNKGTAHKKGAQYRVSWSYQVCAQCHNEQPLHYKVEHWLGSAHASPGLAVAHGTFENRGTFAAHCGRCHSAQGFARYVGQLAKGNAGYLVKDDGSAADEAFLRDLGLQTASVEPTTCSACHDPHDATNPNQLRLHDKIKALPNGMKDIAGVGKGALCMACHNTRNGEHNDFVDPTTSYSGPHAPSQTDVLYGFNAYFVDRYTPSAHLTVKDTCVGCHVSIPTPGQAALEQTTNHTFKPDPALCQSCHGAGVDGVALKAYLIAQLASAEDAILAKVLAVLAATVKDNGSFLVRAWDADTDLYSHKDTPNVVIDKAPAKVEEAHIHGQTGFILHLPAKVKVTWTDGKSADIDKLYVQAGDLIAGAKGKEFKIFAPDSVVMKSLWNVSLLHGDGSRGLHNPAFFKAVLGATQAALAK